MRRQIVSGELKKNKYHFFQEKRFRVNAAQHDTPLGSILRLHAAREYLSGLDKTLVLS
jgi:hypothetical protein